MAKIKRKGEREGRVFSYEVQTYKGCPKKNAPMFEILITPSRNNIRVSFRFLGKFS